MDHRWTIDQLPTVAQKALETAGYDGQPSARVRSMPDQRTIRYYTTLGLIDPPVEMRGRKAFYGQRHVLQLAAVKRLQAKGLALVEVQQALAGADQGTLEQLAAVPVDFWDSNMQVPPAQRRAAVQQQANLPGRDAATTRDRACFWTSVLQPSLARQELPAVASRSWQARTAVHFAVAEGVELVIEGIGPAGLDPTSLEQLAPALEHLAETFRRLRHLASGVARQRPGQP